MASFSVALILLPNDAIDYGTAGVAIIISKLTGFELPIMKEIISSHSGSFSTVSTIDEILR